MFGSEIIDTAIGLIFVFLLVSVLVTVVNELIAAMMLSRAKWLQFGVARLIGSEWATRLYAHPLIEGTAASDKPVTVAASRPWRGSGPSYLPSRSFADVLIHLVIESDRWLPTFADLVDRATTDVRDGDVETLVKKIEASVAASSNAVSYRLVVDDLTTMLRANAKGKDYPVGRALVDVRAFVDAMPLRYLANVIDALPPGDKIRKTLQLLIRESRRDVDRFKEAIELWFDNGMDRVSGWYKRRAQWVAFGLGLAAAVALNVDPLAIGSYLQTHAGVRDAIVAKAKAYAVPPPATADAASQQFDRAQKEFIATRDDLARLGLPIGWNGDDPKTSGGLGGALNAHWLGWLITALAATLGAPFWFDLLNRIVSIRSAGKAPEEKPRPPKAKPLPLGPGEDPEEAQRSADDRR